MKYIICTLLILTGISNDLWSQQHPFSNNRHFEFEGQYYDLNYRGVSRYMKDRSVYDTEIYDVMEATFKPLKEKRITGLIVGSAGLAGGLIMSGVALTRLTNFNNPMNTEAYYRSMLWSTGFILGGGIAYFIIAPNRNDYLAFLSQHNRSFRDRQVRFGLTTNAHGWPGIGLVLQY